MNSTIKTVLFWAVIVVSAFLLWQVVKTGSNAQKEKEIGFSEFLSDVDQGNVRDVMFIGGHFYSDKSPVPTVLLAGGYRAWRAVGGPAAADRCPDGNMAS